MELKEIDPWEVTVSELNERQVEETDSEFVENVRQMGLIQPPIVRTLNGEGPEARMGAKYAAVVGGRRVGAAQEADLESIPVVVMDEWDDGDALAASISENIESFRRDVSDDDRAIALQRLKDLNEWTFAELADHLGVSDRRVRDWLEPARDEWEGTSFHADVKSDEKNKDSFQTDIGRIEDSSEKEVTRNTSSGSRVKKQTLVRQITGGGEEGEQVMQKVAKEGLSLHDTEELKQRVERGQDVDTAIQDIKESKEPEGEIKVSTRVVFTGDYAEAIETAAKDRGASDEEVVQVAVERWLEQEDYV
jgi:ParB/RepB/Spo0J family partition protein